jgi:hypothetical protein
VSHRYPVFLSLSAQDFDQLAPQFVSETGVQSASVFVFHAEALDVVSLA